MFCLKCGFQIPDDSQFCPNCGAPVSHGQQPPVQTQMPPNNGVFVTPTQVYDPNSFVNKLKTQLASPLFMVICILLTGSALQFGIFPILFAIAAWITYYHATRPHPGLAQGGMKFTSGTISGAFVVNWVLCGLMALCGIMFALFCPMMMGIQDEITAELSSGLLTAELEDIMSMMTEAQREIYQIIIDFMVYNTAALFGLFAVFFIVYAIWIAVYNAVFYARFKKFAKGICDACTYNDATHLSFKGVSGFLMTIGVIGCVGNFISLISGGGVTVLFSACGSVAFIIASIWVKKLKESVETPAIPLETPFENGQNFENIQ